MTAACHACGFDPSARVVATWEFHIDRDCSSLNKHVVNAGRSRWAYAKERDLWQWEFRAVRLLRGIPRRDSKRRVTFTRNYYGRQRELDADNYRGGLKCVVDAMVREMLLTDDDAKHFEGVYKQVRTTPQGLSVRVEEMG